MDSLTYSGWRAMFDRGATIQAHAAMLTGGAEKCKCQSCRNYAAQKPVTFPSDFLELLSKLGIDPIKEIEVYEMEPDDPRGVEYYGWFYFVGQVEADAGEPDPGPSDVTFSYYLSPGPAYAVAQFDDLPISRVEFQCLRLPWAKGFSPGESPE